MNTDLATDSVHASILQAALSCLAALRECQPHVHVLTSTVAQELTANVLLALGAQPSMSSACGEVEAFASRTDAFIANLGMLDEERRVGLTAALPIIQRRGVPWVFDPVKVERSPQRAAFAKSLLAFEPHALRANAMEMPLLRGQAPAAVLATTGDVDRIEAPDGRMVEIANGHPLMAQVTAVGCAGTAVVGAFLVIEADAWLATAAALLTLGVAGEIAGEMASGPGSFRAGLIDQLYLMDAPTLQARARFA